MVTTGGRDDAERLGEALVVERLAACCSVVPMVHSIYWWKGQLEREHEALLLIKTLESQAQAAQEYVASHHDYDRAEVLQVPIDGGSSRYLNWLETQVAKPSR